MTRDFFKIVPPDNGRVASYGLKWLGGVVIYTNLQFPPSDEVGKHEILDIVCFLVHRLVHF